MKMPTFASVSVLSGVCEGLGESLIVQRSIDLPLASLSFSSPALHILLTLIAISKSDKKSAQK